MTTVPLIIQRHRICVICEGNEDYQYFKQLISLKCWDEAYSFTTINAKGASRIPARFQNEYQNDMYEIILVFCDTDKAPYREYAQVREKINLFLGRRKAFDKLVIFANPCTMQIVLLHFGDVSLKKQGKKTNSKIIEELTGIQDYDAHDEQIRELCSKINRTNYLKMKKRLESLSDSDTVSGSTNISLYLQRFERGDDHWISEIRKACLQLRDD